MLALRRPFTAIVGPLGVAAAIAMLLLSHSRLESIIDAIMAGATLIISLSILRYVWYRAVR